MCRSNPSGIRTPHNREETPSPASLCGRPCHAGPLPSIRTSRFPAAYRHGRRARAFRCRQHPLRACQCARDSSAIRGRGLRRSSHPGTARPGRTGSEKSWTTGPDKYHFAPAIGHSHTPKCRIWSQSVTVSIENDPPCCRNRWREMGMHTVCIYISRDYPADNRM